MRDVEEIQIKYYEHDEHVYLHEPITNFIFGPYNSKEEADKHKKDFLEDLIVEGRSKLDLW